MKGVDSIQAGRALAVFCYFFNFTNRYHRRLRNSVSRLKDVSNVGSSLVPSKQFLFDPQVCYYRYMRFYPSGKCLYKVCTDLNIFV